ELDVFGMIGVGAVYLAFKRGVLTCDDEVAVAHLPGEVGYRPISDALVNLRDGLARAAKAGIITARTRDALVELARMPFYRERSWARLLADGRTAGLPARQLAALEAWPKPDRKAEDARLLLRTLARTPLRTPRAPKVPRTWALRQLERLSRPS
ncbi:MAG TPA: TfuA-like protein, partial [Kofleriaceae bacterium]|nr:TfuA-like protein [Kofleriaceae bacterium]